MAFLFGVLFTVAAQAQAGELVYFNSPTCGVCERWNEEIGVIYDKTDEAKRLPLRPINIHDDKPIDLSFIKGVTYTPTFVMVEDGREVGRIVGYIADYFFWEQVSNLIKKADDQKGTKKGTKKGTEVSSCAPSVPGAPQTAC
jgi:protein-disulfide isomerase